MKVRETGLPGLVLVEPDVYHDPRGTFLEAWNRARYTDFPDFVQDNRSISRQGVVRGLHYQHPNGQGKLLSVAWGEVFDVGVDIRRGSPTFGGWWGTRLSSENHHQLYLPPGFAHGFAVLSELAVVTYKCSAPYSPEDEHTLLWNDPEIGIEWPVTEPQLSEKDRAGRPLADLGDDALPTFDDASDEPGTSGGPAGDS